MEHEHTICRAQSLSWSPSGQSKYNLCIFFRSDVIVVHWHFVVNKIYWDGWHTFETWQFFFIKLTWNKIKTLYKFTMFTSYIHTYVNTTNLKQLRFSINSVCSLLYIRSLDEESEFWQDCPWIWYHYFSSSTQNP